MKILVTGLCNNYGGIESFFFGYFREIIRQHKDITFDILGYNGVVNEEEIINSGGIVYTINSFNNNEIDCFMKEHANDYDIVWSNQVDLSTISIVKYAKKYGVKRIILHSHCSSMMGSGLSKLKKLFFHYLNKKVISNYVTDYWACSDFAAKWLFPDSVVREDVIYIPNAIKASKYKFDDSIRKKKRIELNCKDEFLIGFIGRLSSEKNPEFAVDVFKEMEKQTKSKLIIIGDGDLRDKLENKIISDGLCEDVMMLGLRNDVNELMQALDFVIIPSIFEGMPMVAIEAQSSGLPIIAAKKGITKMVKLLPTTKLIPLSDGAKNWSNEILKNKVADRNIAFNIVTEKGFNLDYAANDLYENLLNI